MNKIIFLLVILFTVSQVNAQTYKGALLYGFQQSVSGGKKPTAGVEEKNTTGNVAIHPRKNLWLYLVMPEKLVFTPTELYLNGKKYRVKTERVTKTPVVFTDASIPDEPKTTVMVPETSRAVWQLTPLAEQKPITSAMMKKLASQNEVMVGYIVKGKKYYASLKKLTWLEPALMQ